MSPGLFSVFWPISIVMASTGPLIFKSFSPFTNPLRISQVHRPHLVSSSTLCSLVVVFCFVLSFFFLFVCCCFFSYLARFRYLSLFLLFFHFHPVVCCDNLNVSEFSQISTTLVSSLTHFSSAVLWMDSIFSNIFSWPSRLGLQNTLTASLQRGKTPLPTSVLYITLNNLMVRLQ